MHSLIKWGLNGLAAGTVCAVAAAPAFAVGAAAVDAGPSEYAGSDLFLLIMYVLMALVFSFLCSVAEAVLLSITPSFIEGLKKDNPKRAALLKRLKHDNVDQSLAAILTLNTIAHTVGAIGSGAKATAVFGSAWFGLFSAVMTLMILFLSEIIPKTIGAVFWRALAAPTAFFVKCLIVLLFPLIWLSEKLTRLIARDKAIHLFSRDEFIAMADIGKRSGHIREKESRIIRNLFRLESLKTKDIMTPRTVIAALSQDATIDEALKGKATTPFSRLPVYGRNIDDITGFVLKTDILLAKANGEHNARLETLKRDIVSVPGTLPLTDLLEYLLDHRQHIALVVDEYGGTRGLVSLEDAVETLLGMEIVDEMDKVEDMQLLARQQWQKRAKALGIDPSADG